MITLKDVFNEIHDQVRKDDKVYFSFIKHMMLKISIKKNIKEFLT